MTATNIFYNFVGFRYIPPLTSFVLWSLSSLSDSIGGVEDALLLAHISMAQQYCH